MIRSQGWALPLSSLAFCLSSLSLYLRLISPDGCRFNCPVRGALFCVMMPANSALPSCVCDNVTSRHVTPRHVPRQVAPMEFMFAGRRRVVATEAVRTTAAEQALFEGDGEGRSLATLVLDCLNR